MNHSSDARTASDRRTMLLQRQGASAQAETKRLLRAFQHGGWPLLRRILADRIADIRAERRWGIATAGLIPIEHLLEEWQDCHDYFPTTIRHFHEFMRHVSATAFSGTFVDVGSGLGRVLILAAQYPFTRVVGVEISERLAREATANFDRCRPNLICQDLEIWMGNGMDFPIPVESTVFYFYNPFHGPILSAVFSAIERSLQEHPREIWVVFNNPVHFLKIESTFGWLRRSAVLEFHPPCLILRSVSYSDATDPTIASPRYPL
jgi:SAM-dependent methyltransferase